MQTPAANAHRLRKLRADNPGYSTKKNAAWQAKNPEKRAAHKAVERALLSGKLVKGPCEMCGVDQTIEAHHDDYLQKLVVRWLCRKHHRMIDKQFACS